MAEVKVVEAKIIKANTAVKSRLPRVGHANRSFIGNVIAVFFLVLLSLFMVFPLLFTINNSFKPLNELLLVPPRFFVRRPTFQNYIDLSNFISNSWVPFSRYLFNTFLITASGTAGHVFIAAHAAYALANNKFAGSKFIFRVIVLSLMFSTAVTDVPSFLIIARLGWMDTQLPVIMPALCQSLGLYLLKQFMETIPDSLLQAARIDGANEFHVLWGIVMPVIKPAWLTLVILSVQSLWNSNSTYIFSEQLKTLTAALNQIVVGGIGRAGTAAAATVAGGISRVGTVGAAAVIMMILPVTVFILTQSNVIETMSTSGMKE